MENGLTSEEIEHPQDVYDAAVTLMNMRDETLDEDTAAILCALKRQILERANAATIRRLSISRAMEEFNNALYEADAANNYRPPSHILQIPGLEGLIGLCSKPFEKQLTESDVKIDQSRLVMSKFYVEKHLKPLIWSEENPRDGIPVTVYDIHGNIYPMEFKVWSERTYVLTAGWKKFSVYYGLTKITDFVTAWMFRNLATGKLCFVINNKRLPAVQSEEFKQRRTIKFRYDEATYSSSSN
ncbi:hypothetical protein ACFE04_016219 [Oxalis oulophora]